jgi:S-adenosyl methyltransferase
MTAGGNRGFDARVAHPARVYDYWLGGKDNFEADRVAGEATIAAYPAIRASARANRAFLARSVRFLAGEVGIRQFLDIGTGLPAANNTHEVAQRAAPDARIVYVDNDPVVLSHAQALLTSTPEGRCDYLDADARDTERILAEAARTLDFGQPVAVMMLAVLHFIPDDDHPSAIAARLMEAVPSGSYLALTHAASDIRSDAIAAAARVYNARSSAPISARSHSAVAGFFHGLDLVPPGVVPLGEWTPGAPAVGVSAGTPLPQYAGLARKP